MSIEKFELASLDEATGSPPAGSRLASASALRSRHAALLREDSERAKARAKIQALFDGMPPYDQSLLLAMGQGSRCNLNFNHAQRYLDLAVSGYVDLAQSVQTLVSVSLPAITDQGERFFHESNINEEISQAIRSWPGFYPGYLRLATTFVGHGVAFALFPSDRDWKFKVCGLGDFHIPQKTPASPDDIEIATAQEDILATDLHAYIRDENAAVAAGWNPDAVKRAILRCANTTDKSRGRSYAWEDVQQRIKNGDFESGETSYSLRLVYGLVREFGNKYSFFITAETGDDEFLCSRPFAYGNFTEAAVPFVFGTGNNGTYHSIRGLGQRIFASCQMLNRLMCQAVDGSMLASSLIIQPSTVEQLQRFQVQNIGGITAVSPGVQFAEKQFSPRLADTVIPMIGMMGESLAENLDFYSATGAAKGSPYRNRLQVEAELEQATRLTSASLSLFYAAWTPLLRQMVKRFIRGSRSTDPYIREFYRRVEERGTPADIVRRIDFDRTIATRAVGGGNAPARVLALNEIMENASMLPEDGRRRLAYDLTAARVGYDNANRYISPPEAPRPTIDISIASLENSSLLQAIPQPVLDNQLHATHLSVHVPEIARIAGGIDDGTLDAMSVLDPLVEIHRHASLHLEFLAGDPFAQAEANEYRAVLQRAGEQILNYSRRAEAEAQARVGGGGEGSSDVKAEIERIKLQREQLKAEFEARTAQIKLRREELKAASDARKDEARLQALDAQTAARILTMRPQA